MHRRSSLLALPLGLAVACTTTRRLAEPVDYVPREVAEVARYDVRHEGESIGVLVQLEIADRDGPVRFWRIENRSGGWLGFASEQGRFSRRMPFRDQDLDLGIWPMARGVAKLFDLEEPVALRPLPLAQPAQSKKSPAQSRRR